jgi:hypothetical protein
MKPEISNSRGRWKWLVASAAWLCLTACDAYPNLPWPPLQPGEPGAGSGGAPAPEPEPEPDECDRERDHATILEMRGVYAVTFDFEEIEALAPEYELQPPYRTNGLEVVIPLEVEPTSIMLQHVLLMDDGSGAYLPLKHWRQDWEYEDVSLWEYQGRRVWQHRTLAEEDARCTWSQAIYQVDDGPRYESFGRWVHTEQESRWSSGETFRPLPRRESARTDYDVLLAINTHIVDEGGWTQAEDNYKLVLDSKTSVARERGTNRYERIDDPAAEEAAHAYMDSTGEFWADVRAEWYRLLDEIDHARVHETIDGVASYDVLLLLAEELAGAESNVRQARIHEVIAPYVEPIEESARE